MRIAKLCEEFERLCKHFYRESDALHMTFENEKKSRVCTLLYRTVKLQLVYSWRWTDLAPPSVVYCRVFLSKNNPLYLHLPELFGYMEEKDFRACYFPYIESAERMQVCFCALSRILLDRLPGMEKLGMTHRAEEILKDWLNRDMRDGNTLDPFSADTWNLMAGIQSSQEFVHVARYTVMDAYAALLRGDREKALKQYKKGEKDLSDYEKALCEYLSAGGSLDLMPAECYAAADYQKYAGQKQDWKGILLLYPFFSALFCILLALINGYLARGAVYYSGIHWSFGLVLGAMPAIFGYPLLQRQITGFLNRKNRKSAMDFFDILNLSGRAKGFVAVVFALCIGLQLLFCFAVSNMSLRLYESHGFYYTEEETLLRFDYDQVTGVYHIKARYNVYGDRVERGSYVLVLRDGTHLDLDGNIVGEEKQKEITDRIAPHIPVTELDSDRDLP